MPISGWMRQIIREVMTAALSHGGDYCDVFLEHTLSTYLVLEDDKVSRAYTSVDLGAGIRVLEGDQTGYSFTEEVTPESMKLAAKTAANIAGTGGGSAPAGFKYVKTPNYFVVPNPLEEVTIDGRFRFCRGSMPDGRIWRAVWSVAGLPTRTALPTS